jgi:hypothetical protein
MSARMRIAARRVRHRRACGGSVGRTVYRCGNSYSTAPCIGATAVDVDDSRDAAQRAEARSVAARERQLAAELVRDRHERELAARPATAASLSAKPVASAPTRKTAHATKKERREIDGRDFVAVVPTSTKK